MRAEKKIISKEYVERLNASPFFIVVDYTGLKVGPFTELRKRLNTAGSQIHVVKNSIFKIATAESGIEDLGAPLSGQVAVVTGEKDISAAAKVVKTFASEFDRPTVRFGFLDNKRLEAADVLAIADLPSIDALRGQLLGVIMAPATKLARVVAAPGTQIARVLQARVDKGE